MLVTCLSCDLLLFPIFVPGGELSLVDELYTRTIIKLVQSILKDSEVAIATDTDEKTISETLSKLSQNSFTLYHGNQRMIGSAVYFL